MWDDHQDRYDMMNGSGATMGFGVLALVLLVLALVAVSVNLYLHLSPRPGRASTNEAVASSEARRVLDRRLASGEITPEEYTSIRVVLEA